MLNRLALRLATVRALRGQTLVNDNVRDSEIGPIDTVAAEHPSPVIVVYTDDAMYHAGHRDLFSTAGDHRVESGWLHLVIEIAITQRMIIDEGGPVEIVQPKTDAGLEFTVDAIERQVLAALANPRSDWAEMWRKFAFELGSRETKRGSMSRDGQRFAGRQLTLQVRIPKEPPPGEAISPLWAGFLALAATDPDLAGLVPTLTALLAGTGAPLTDYEAVRAAFALTDTEARAMLFGPPSVAASAP